MTQYADILAAAGDALSGPGGAPVPLRLVEAVVDYPGSRTVILRCVPAEPSPELPASVIVKHWRSPGGGGFARERAALDLLGQAGVAGVVPAGYGAEATAELLVLEDLAGPGEDSRHGEPGQELG